MKYILALLLLFTLVSCYTVDRNCENFKTGKFRSEIIIDGKKQVYDFERTETMEIGNFNGDIDTTSIRWINDCEYIGNKVNPKNMQEQKAVHIKILSTDEKSYNFEFSIVDDPNKQKGTVKKLN